MSRLSKILVLTVVAASLAIVSGCQLFDTTSPNLAKKGRPGNLVFKKEFCVSFDELQTSGSFSSQVVCDQLKADILNYLAKGSVGDKVAVIRMSGGVIKVTGNTGDHDWEVTAAVEIKRQDDPSGPVTDGPSTLVNSSTVTLRGLKKDQPMADLNSMGVNVVNRALEDLLAGDDPRLVVTMMGASVDPEPSPLDPLDFTWRACIELIGTATP